jgi:hypothetical protein
MWEAYENSYDELHVMPDHDKIAHAPFQTCFCKPELDPQTKNYPRQSYVHNDELDRLGLDFDVEYNS